MVSWVTVTNRQRSSPCLYVLELSKMASSLYLHLGIV